MSSSRGHPTGIRDGPSAPHRIADRIGGHGPGIRGRSGRAPGPGCSITTTEARPAQQLSAHLVVFVGMALVLIGVVVDGVRSGRRSRRHATQGRNLDAIR